MAYNDMGALLKSFAKHPMFDEIAHKVFLFYVSRVTSHGARDFAVEWDLRTPVNILGISRTQYDLAGVVAQIKPRTGWDYGQTPQVLKDPL